jgi:hypothetical protein
MLILRNTKSILQITNNSLESFVILAKVTQLQQEYKIPLTPVDRHVLMCSDATRLRMQVVLRIVVCILDVTVWGLTLTTTQVGLTAEMSTAKTYLSLQLDLGLKQLLT